MPPANSARPIVAVIGATGAVGMEMLRCLEKSPLGAGTVRGFASERSVGRKLAYRGGDIELEALSPSAFEGVHAALFASEADISKEYAPLAVKAGAIAVDNSSAFRMDAAIPLVVPEVNGDLLGPDTRLVANPNCVAAIMAVALWPLHQVSRIKRIIASTYQSASGAGAAAMEELDLATRAYLKGEAYAPKVLPHPYAFNLFSHNASVDPVTGYNGEESKVVAEMRKIMRVADLPVGITCIRVPVLRAHSMALTVEFESAISVDEARKRISAAPGLRLVDDRARNHFPMPVESSGIDEVLVGRIREDISDVSGKSLALWVSGDQLLKGAALNAVQIAERLLKTA